MKTGDKVIHKAKRIIETYQGVCKVKVDGKWVEGVMYEGNDCMTDMPMVFVRTKEDFDENFEKYDYLDELGRVFQTELRSCDLHLKHNMVTINSSTCADKVEIQLFDDYEIKQEGDRWFAVKKRPKYPQSYEECCKVLNYCCNPTSVKTTHKEEQIRKFQFLLLFRDAYWKLADDWKPDWSFNEETKYCIGVSENTIISTNSGVAQYVLAFPTPEMRDAFQESEEIRLLIEDCKEFL